MRARSSFSPELYFVWLLLFSVASLPAQDAASPAGVTADPAIIQPPPVPVGTANVAPPAVAPPSPGELQALPAAPRAMPPTAPVPPSGISDTQPAPVPGAAAATVPSVALPRARVTSSTSTTGQFIIHGESLPLRSAFSSKCEEISQSLRKLLKDTQPWGVPIVVLLSSGDTAAKATKPATTTISQLSHGGFHIQVTLHLRADLRQADVRRELLRALLAERILRGQKQIVSQRPLLLPDWFFTGVIEALDYRSRSRPSALFAAIFKSGKIYSIEEIIEATPGNLDALSKTLYQTSCCALVLSLLDQPEGGTRMAAFLSALAADTRPERQLLNQHFPGIASSASSLNKWWAIQLAALASPTMAEPMDLEETIVQLESALTFRFQAPVSELPSPKPPPPAAQPQLASDQPPTTVAEATTKAEENAPPPRSFLSRLNPFFRKQQPQSASDSEQSPDAIIAAAIEKTALAQIEAPITDLESTEEDEGDNPSLLTRILRRTRPQAQDASNPPEPLIAAPSPLIIPAKEPTTASTSSKTAPTIQESTATPADDPPEPTRRSMLNPLNWFRRSTTSEDESPSPDEAPAAIEKPATTHHTPSIAGSHLLSAALRLPLGLPPPFTLLQPASSLLAQNFLGIRFGKKKTPPDSPDTPLAEPTSSLEPRPANPPPASELPASSPAEPTPRPDTPEPEMVENTTESREDPALHVSDLNPLKWFRKKAAPRVTSEEAPSIPESSTASPPAPTPPPPAPQPSPPASAATPSPIKAPALIAASLPLEDYATVLKRKDAKKILDTNILAIAALQNRAHVMLRSVIAEYSLLLTDLYEGKTQNAPARIAQLRRRTREAIERAKELRAMLDLHEANTPGNLSGLFDDYLRLPETLKSERPERTDPISRYLDSIEREFASGRE